MTYEASYVQLILLLLLDCSCYHYYQYYCYQSNCSYYYPGTSTLT